MTHIGYDIGKWLPTAVCVEEISLGAAEKVHIPCHQHTPAASTDPHALALQSGMRSLFTTLGSAWIARKSSLCRVRGGACHCDLVSRLRAVKAIASARACSHISRARRGGTGAASRLRCRRSQTLCRSQQSLRAFVPSTIRCCASSRR